MRFFTVAALALAATVSAQESTTGAASTGATSTTSQAPPPTHSPTAEELCLAKCGAADICCQAACVHVPCPSELQANTTTECAAKCDQGNGTQEETEAYGRCQSSCISSYFFTSTGGAGASATGESSGTATFGGSETTSAGGSGSSSTASANGAVETRVVVAGAGLLSLIVAGLAL